MRASEPGTVQTPDTRVNTAEVRRGLDGKLYRSAPLTRQERGAAIRLSHRLVCAGHLSVRAAQRVMAEEHGIRRSRGAIASDIANYECPVCADRSGGQLAT
jgi:hypothetical protein